MAERDPKATPEFGDVFVWLGLEDDPIMFLVDGEDWTGLSLRSGGVTTGYQDLDDPDWVFVEHIGVPLRLVAGIDFPIRAVHRGLVLGLRKLSRLSDAEYEETFGRARP